MGNGAETSARWSKAAPMALVVVVAVAVGSFVLWRSTAQEPSCDALVADVAGLDGWSDRNGITSYGSEWVGVLTQAPDHADDPSRAAIAAAVAGDEDGFRRFRSALPDDLEAPADRLQAVVLDPAADGDGAGVAADADAVGGHVSTTCNVLL